MTVEKTKTTSILLFVFRYIPLVVRKGFFRIGFSLFYHLVAKSRLIVLHNLQRSFPEKDSKEIIKIAKGVYSHFAIVAAEFFDLTSITRETIDQWVEMEGMEYADTALSQNKGALSIVAHFGNWELLTIAIPMLVRPMYIVYRPLDSPVIDNMVEYVRTMHGNSLIPKGGIGEKGFGIIKRASDYRNFQRSECCQRTREFLLISSIALPVPV